MKLMKKFFITCIVVLHLIPTHIMSVERTVKLRIMPKLYWFVFYKEKVLLQMNSDGTYSVPFSIRPPVEIKRQTHILHVTPTEDGTEVRGFSIDTPNNNKIFGYAMCDLRASYYKLPKELYLKAGKCRELIYWDHNTHYCGVCGTPMEMCSEISKYCPNCGKEVWPQLATAVIVLVHKGDEVLLVHAKNFKSDFYGLIAGFVETGETLEEAVHREIREETGITVTNLKYFGSQPWPYPCGLMVGFNADYVCGDIQIQQSELSKGAWFHKDNLPTIPEKLSIARMILDNWLDTFNH